MLKDLAWLRTELGRKLNFNTTQTNQDFAGPAGNPYSKLDSYLNEAYNREVAAAKIEVGFRPFAANASLTWTASAQTLAIPQHFLDCQIIKIDDETDATPGTTLWVGSIGQGTTIIWRDRSTLSWGTTGPASDRTLTISYVAEAAEMTVPTQAPVLIPPAHRYLIIWSAACIARAEADERAPEEWRNQLSECRQQYHTLLSRGTIAYPLNYTVLETDAFPGSSAASTTAGIGGGIG